MLNQSVGYVYLLMLIFVQFLKKVEKDLYQPLLLFMHVFCIQHFNALNTDENQNEQKNPKHFLIEKLILFRRMYNVERETQA